jgi:hypothetical protein
MTKADGFSVKACSPSAGDKPPTCQLFYKGHDTGTRLPGALLEASFRVGDEWLLFLTDDIPFEESLEICLLDSKFQVADRATLAAPYAAGNFADLKVLSNHRLQFRFLGQGVWRLELLPDAAFRLPFVSEPLGVTRPFGFSRRFVLSHLEDAPEG